MGDYKFIAPFPSNQTIFKITSSGVKFKVKMATGNFSDITLMAAHDPNVILYKIKLGCVTTIRNETNRSLQQFTYNQFAHFMSYKFMYITWHSHSIEIGLVNEKPFVKYKRTHDEPQIGFVNFHTICTEPRRSVEWTIESSPVMLKSLTRKNIDGHLYWARMSKNSKVLPPDAMIGGFEKELIYIARAEHNDALTPGKYVRSVGSAFISWGRSEHRKTEFEILCGYNARWVKTKSNLIPSNAFVAGGFAVNYDQLFIGRAMVNGNLICGKVTGNLCYLPYQGKEVEVTHYEILVI